MSLSIRTSLEFYDLQEDMVSKETSEDTALCPVGHGMLGSTFLMPLTQES